MYSWGLNKYGCLGIGEEDTDIIVDAPKLIESLLEDNFQNVFTGKYFSLAL